MNTESPIVVSRKPKPLAHPTPADVPAAAPASTPRVFAPALLSAALLYLSYFPVDWGWLGWVALVPLLGLVRTSARPWRVYLAAWMSAAVFYLGAIQWMRVADYRMYATWLLLTLHCSLFALPALYLLRRLDRRAGVPLTLSLPLVWTGLELARAHLWTGFPWYFLAHSQHAYLPVIQVADLGGAYLVTFVVAAGNGLVFEWLWTRPRVRAWLGEPAAGPPSYLSLGVQTAAVVVAVGSALGYGYWRLGQDSFDPGPRLALIQGNLDQRIRNAVGDPGTVYRYYSELGDEAAMKVPKPDLIVWPETSYPKEWVELAPGVKPDEVPPEWSRAVRICRRDVFEDIADWHTNVLLGLNAWVRGTGERPERFNSALLLLRDGKVGGRYDKMHRVPFGEYVPLRDWLPWMNTLAPYDFDYSISAGREFTRFPLGPYHFGVVICYEDTDPDLARQYVRPDENQPTVDFLVNISNDGWFIGTSEHEEHLAICRFRAVESRRAVARAVNMGISAVIDGNGRIVALPGADWERSKKVEAVLTGVVPIDRRTSLYARLGDWVPWGCWAGIVVGLVVPGLRRRRAHATLDD